MSGFVLSQHARPDDVADALEVWVRCRVDADVGARLLARRLARTCRVLAAMHAARLIDENWAAAWERARTEAAALFAGAGEPMRRSEYPVPSEERITLTDLGTCPTDRVTPLLPRGVVDDAPSSVSSSGSVRGPRVAGR